MHWCDLCKVWMNDTKAAKLNHERGMKHQETLARSEHTAGPVGCLHGSRQLLPSAAGPPARPLLPGSGRRPPRRALPLPA
jgi:hypothetical protein